ncbi:hypothetical protein HMPREF1986_02741 [Oribacterium sp. oral taxon 078 str. F0263]|nr:hypothetical protein HMPREF1986_02741 [Oribacterium sp. oral taxon 078 str. F0263]
MPLCIRHQIQSCCRIDPESALRIPLTSYGIVLEYENGFQIQR